MPNPPRILRSALTLLLLAVSVAGVGSRQLSSGGSAPPAGHKAVAASADWKEVDRLVSEQKLEEAGRKVEQILASARARKDEPEWTRALVRAVALRLSLHGYETAVRLLKEQPWPGAVLSRATLNLVYAQALQGYARAYSWEISKRERIESRSPVDLTSWTREQIFAEIERACRDVWNEREALGRFSVERLSEFLEPNTYPRSIRGTLRDAAAYLFVELLGDTTGWTPKQSNEIYRLDLAVLLAREGSAASAQLADPGVHPLEKIVAVLADLESWHTGVGRREAALEARLERLRVLSKSFTQASDRERIRQDLERRLPDYRKFPWWSMGMAALAELHEGESAPENLARARAVAREGTAAFPDSPGGRRCLSIAARIEAPDYRLASMSSDGPGRRSVEVTHRNLADLYFRAYAVDLQGRIGTARDWNLLPSGPEVQNLVRSQRPVAEWSVALPATPDFKPHRTFVTPPLAEPGLYVIAASARKDFSEASNRIASVNLIVTDLVVITRTEPESVEARVVSGRTGAPVAGVTVDLDAFDWRDKHRRVEIQTTDGDGLARFNFQPGRETSLHFLLARRGSDMALDSNGLSFWKPPAPAETTATLLYTDRSVYRPGQKILWKALLFSGRTDRGRFATLAGDSLTVSLLDANSQRVDSKTVATNGFGTASGEFAIPAGRVLGNWRLESSRSGAAWIGVEEYKRPTFEVSWKNPEAALRLNRPAALTGSARYYFGLPVVGGAAKWRVTREPEFPWWWSSRRRPAAERAQTVGQGVSRLEPDGTFRIGFTPSADERIGGAQEDVSYVYRASAEVTDEGGETRSAERSFRLGLVAVEASFQMETGFFREKVPAVLTIVRSDLDGTPRPGEAHWRLYELRQPEKTVLPADVPLETGASTGELLTPGDRLRPRWDTRQSVDEVLKQWPDGSKKASGVMTHDDRGEARLTLPELSAGPWRLRYETVDPFGAKYETAKDFLVAGKAMSLKLPAALVPESSTVAAGGTLRLLALSGFPDQALFLETFRDGRLLERRELAGAGPGLVEIPIGEEDRGGLVVRLSAVRDHQFLEETRTVLVPWDDRKLAVSFATFRDKLRPGGRETWRVTVRSEAGERAPERAAELLAYMYDRSLDFFRPHLPPDPLSYYPNRAIPSGVRASVAGTPGQWVSEKDFVPAPPREELPRGDRVRIFAGYGIGGPGARATRAVGGVSVPMTSFFAASPPSERVAQQGATRMTGEEPLRRVAAEPEPRPKVIRPAPPIELRGDFAETAFWQPHLTSDAQGEASIEFTVPDSVTSWKVWVHAITRDLKAGSVEKEVRSVKDLMVRPYLPRFFREGDRAQMKVVVNNASSRHLSGRIALDIRDTENDASALDSFGLLPGDSARAFSVLPGGSTDAAFALTAPTKTGTYAFRVTAVSGDTSDGELRPVPVLPGRLHLLQSRFVTLKDDDRRTMTFEDLGKSDDPTRINEKMVVTVDAQLFYSVLDALPYLVNYPYECTEQTLNRFLSTGIVSSVYRDYPAVAKMAEELSKRSTPLEAWSSPDPNRGMALEETPWLETARGGRETGLPLVNVLDPRIARGQRENSLAKLAKTQTSIGGFPWWPGGPPSPYMTLYLMYGFAKAAEFGVEVPKDMVQRGWQYLSRHFREQYAARLMRENRGWEFLTFVNFVAASYPDETWTSGALTVAERRDILAFCFGHWREESPLLKGQLALTLKRMGRPADARLVWDSVMDSARTDPDLGTYWAPEARSWLWYNDTIETHAFALTTLLELSPQDPRSRGLVQWLFLNKKLNQWKSTRATAEVISALVRYLKRQGELGVREEASVTVGPVVETFVFDPERYTGKKNQLVVPGEKIDRESSARVTVEKRGKGLGFASATWHFSTEKLPAEDRGDFFAVSRRYFVRESGPQGLQVRPLAEGAVVKAGDQIEVRISLSSRHAAEYVHLRDPRAAGLEPESAASGYKWDAVGWYEETRDSGTNFFFEDLPAGELTLKYRVRAAMAGVFRIGPATVQSLYAPEFAAYSAGAVLRIEP